VLFENDAVFNGNDNWMGRFLIDNWSIYFSRRKEMDLTR
jgi:hypothetical protein